MGAVHESKFHYFPQLPRELRDAIWRLCIPQRVRETHRLDYYEIFRPCASVNTSIENAKPPTIARICRESRLVAYEIGGPKTETLEIRSRPESANWHRPSGFRDQWVGISDQDELYTSCHFTYDAEYNYESRAVPALAWEAAALDQSASIDHEVINMYRLCTSSLERSLEYDHSLVKMRYCYRENDLPAFFSVKSWTVIVDTVFIHCDATQTNGLFGLLNDAPIQIVLTTEQSRLYNLMSLARRYCKQMLEIKDEASSEAYLRSLILYVYGSIELTTRMRPAIMFRWCRDSCLTRIASEEATTAM